MGLTYLGGCGLAAVGLGVAGLAGDLDHAAEEAVAAHVLGRGVAAGDVVAAGDLGGEGRGGHGDGQDGEDAGELHVGGCGKWCLEKRKMVFWFVGWGVELKLMLMLKKNSRVDGGCEAVLNRLFLLVEHHPSFECWLFGSASSFPSPVVRSVVRKSLGRVDVHRHPDFPFWPYGNVM